MASFDVNSYIVNCLSMAGAFLSIGGFLSFMLTGSISAIRFGVILGSALLALSVASLRSWKSGKSSELLLKGQAGQLYLLISSYLLLIVS